MKNIDKILAVFSGPRTITGDLTVGLGIVVSVCLVLFGFLNYFILVNQVETDLINRANNSAKQLADILSVPLWTLDIQTIQKIGQTYQQSADVVEVTIMDESSQTFFAAALPEQNKITRIEDIFYNGHKIGIIQFSLSTRKINDVQLVSFLTTFSIIFLVVLAIHLASRVILKLYLTRPLTSLRKGIDAIANGQGYHELKSVPQVDINAIVQDVNAMSRQIDERVLALKTSEERFRQVVGSISDMLYMIEVAEKGPITKYLSPHVDALTGYSSSCFLEDVSFWPRMVIHADDHSRARQQFEHLLRGENGEMEYRLVRKDQSVIWVRDSATVEKSEGKILIFGVVSDISERKKVEAALQVETRDREQAEIELRKYQGHLEEMVSVRTSELEVLNRELESFAYTVSHDLRAPLRHVDGYSQVIIEDYESQIPTEVVQYLQRMRRSIQHLNNLLDGLLKLARISRQPLSLQCFEPKVMVQQVVDELMENQKGRQIHFVIGELPVCQADIVLVQQVFTNLISNAIKYTLRKDLAVIEINAMQQDGQTVYFVRDNGIGFDMQFSSKLFGVFQRLNSDKDFDGTGVGLAIVQRIIQRHGGRIWAEGSVGQGATFYFTFVNGVEK